MSSERMEPGQVFAERYRIERFLAQGGFGAVYVAEQLATELRVALKVLWPHVLSSADAVEKFKQEARIAGRVNSAHIVQVIDAGFDGESGMPFLAMELLHGDDLQKLVARSGPLPPDAVALYLRQVASALDKAHGFRDREGRPTPIIHRDLKPENLFLTHREDGTPLVKVLDFGIAKVLSDATKASQHVKGTPLYMAFEQAAGRPISPATDVWALGLIAFFLLTGRVYWRAASVEGSGLEQVFGEVFSLPIVPPSRRIAEMGWGCAVPSAFDDWFLRCVHREPASRFRSAGEAATMLSMVLGAGPIGAEPVSAGTPPSLTAPPSGAAVALSTPVDDSVPEVQRPPGSTSIVALGASQAVPLRGSTLPLGLLVLAAVALATGIAVWARTPGPARGTAGAAPAPSAEVSAPQLVSSEPRVVVATPLPTAPQTIASTSASAPRPPAPPHDTVPARPGPSAPSIAKPPVTAPTAKPRNVYDER